MKKTNLFFFALFIAANVFVGCDRSLYDAPVVEQTKSIKASNVDRGEAVSFWYGGKKMCLTPDYSSSFIVYNSDKNVVASHKILSGGDFKPTASFPTTRASQSQKKKWAIVDGSVLQSRSVKDDVNICYQSPIYKRDNGDIVKLSNLIYVMLKSQEDSTIMYEQMKKYGLTIYSHNQFMPEWYSLSCDTNAYGTALDVCLLLHDTGLFEVVEPDIIGAYEQLSVTAFQIPNDPYYNQQWYLHGANSINWEEASTLATGENVEIGLVDTGVECSHPDFDLSYVKPLYDAHENSWYAAGMYNSHGTQNAGVIAAVKNNNIGITGICSKARLSSIADPLDEIDCINQADHLASDLYVALTECDVVNCSWGNPLYTATEILNVIKYYKDWGRNGKGAVLVFASGKNGGNVYTPANSNPDILVVGASDANGKKADFSCYGSTLDVVAPGVNILTLGFQNNSSYSFEITQGTSVASPQVAAIAALVLSINPDLTNIEVNDIIEKTAQKVGGYSYTITSGRPNGTWNNYMGYGLVDATAAVKAAQATLSK